MFKKLIPTFVLLAGLWIPCVHAQLAKQKAITSSEIMAQLLTHLKNGGSESEATLAKEALALEKSKNEEFVIMSVWLYKQMELPEKAQEVQGTISKRFPRGITARGKAYAAIFSDEDRSTSELEKAYRRWLKNFPAASYTEQQQDIYRRAQTKMAIRHFSAGEYAQAKAYLEQLKITEEFPFYAHAIGSTLNKSGHYELARPLLETGFLRSLASLESGTDARRKVSLRYYASLAPAYAKALLETGAPDQAVEVLTRFLEITPRASRRADITSMLASGYSAQGLNLEAALILNNFLIEYGMDQEILGQITPLYKKINGEKGHFENYLGRVKLKANAMLHRRLEEKMVKKEAPLFSLVNRKGQIIKLSDLRGKVVVLDFWATWCGPCKMSFPGMQAAVNKYKNDPDVEFLFIDTWQREDNYKELVNKFISDNNYTFHVLFDEMKNKDKATTTHYGVKGIPHKVVIDPEGFIRFESSGGSADVNKLVNELSIMIELARKG